jgi:hypothetical protein
VVAIVLRHAKQAPAAEAEAPRVSLLDAAYVAALTSQAAASLLARELDFRVEFEELKTPSPRLDDSDEEAERRRRRYRSVGSLAEAMGASLVLDEEAEPGGWRRDAYLDAARCDAVSHERTAAFLESLVPSPGPRVGRGGARGARF